MLAWSEDAFCRPRATDTRRGRPRSGLGLHAAVERVRERSAAIVVAAHEVANAVGVLVTITVAHGARSLWRAAAAVGLPIGVVAVGAGICNNEQRYAK